MSLFRDSWELWRRKVNEALGGLVEPVKSEDVTYDNTDSGLTATDVQSAIDEVVGDISDVEAKITVKSFSGTTVEGGWVVSDIPFSTKKIATLGCNIGAKFVIATKDGNNDFWNWKITDKDFVAVSAGTDVTIYYIEL